MSTRPRPEENPVFAKLREMRAIQDDVQEKMDLLLDRMCQEARALHTGARDGRSYTLREIGQALGVGHSTVNYWIKRGTETSESIQYHQKGDRQ